MWKKNIKYLLVGSGVFSLFLGLVSTTKTNYISPNPTQSSIDNDKSLDFKKFESLTKNERSLKQPQAKPKVRPQAKPKAQPQAKPKRFYGITPRDQIDDPKKDFVKPTVEYDVQLNLLHYYPIWHYSIIDTLNSFRATFYQQNWTKLLQQKVYGKKDFYDWFNDSKYDKVVMEVDKLWKGSDEWEKWSKVDPLKNADEKINFFHKWKFDLSNISKLKEFHQGILVNFEKDDWNKYGINIQLNDLLNPSPYKNKLDSTLFKKELISKYKLDHSREDFLKWVKKDIVNNKKTGILTYFWFQNEDYVYKIDQYKKRDKKCRNNLKNYERFLKGFGKNWKSYDKYYKGYDSYDKCQKDIKKDKENDYLRYVQSFASETIEDLDEYNFFLWSQLYKKVYFKDIKKAVLAHDQNYANQYFDDVILQPQTINNFILQNDSSKKLISTWFEDNPSFGLQEIEKAKDFTIYTNNHYKQDLQSQKDFTKWFNSWEFIIWKRDFNVYTKNLENNKLELLWDASGWWEYPERILFMMGWKSNANNMQKIFKEFEKYIKKIDEGKKDGTTSLADTIKKIYHSSHLVYYNPKTKQKIEVQPKGEKRFFTKTTFSQYQLDYNKWLSGKISRKLQELDKTQYDQETPTFLKEYYPYILNQWFQNSLQPFKIYLKSVKKSN